MINVIPLTDSTSLLGDGVALRARWEEDGTLYFRNVIDVKLMAWAEQHYRKALADEGLIDLANEAPVWTGKKSNTWRPCDAIGTTVWHEVVKQPGLNAILHELFQADAAWLPIVAHRSAFPSSPLTEDQDIFAGQHQDAFYNEGMNSTICWMPVRDILDMNRGTFALAPGVHKKGVLHSKDQPNYRIPEGSIPKDAWRSAAYRVGDVVIFRDDTPHAALPNLSNEFRLSMDLRVGSSLAPQPVAGTVESVEGTDVTIRTDDTNELVTVHVSDETYIRDMNPHPRVPTSEVQRVAYPGARVLAMAGADRNAKVLRRNRY
jgi:ectoine hydroxylase-related dioxygenase (phytanoyl-CoA dioxygenase family)